MSTPLAAISEADWQSWPSSARDFIRSQQQENENLCAQLPDLTSELASLREQNRRVGEVVEHHPQACRRCGTLLQGEDPEPLRQQVIEHRLVCPCCSTSTCAALPADVEASRYGPRLSALVGVLRSAFPLSFSKTQALLHQLLGEAFSGVVVSDRFSAYNHLPLEQRQLCWRM